MRAPSPGGSASALRVRLPRPGRLELSVRLRPAATAHAMLIAAAGGRGGLMPLATRRGISDVIGVAGRVAYRPLTAADEFYPDAILPDIADTPGWVRDYADTLADTDPDLVLAELAERYPHPAPQWRAVLADPKAWLDTLARSLLATEPVVSARWVSARARLDVEAARIDRLLTAGGPAMVLGSLSAPVSTTATELRITHPHDITHGTAATIRLVPLITGPGAYLLYGLGSHTHLGYPVLGMGELDTPTPEPAHRVDRLAATLGPARARVLRAVGTPCTVTTLARHLDSAVSTISYHCTGLHAAGLIDTVRSGRNVWIIRTELGTKLIDLLSTPGN